MTNSAFKEAVLRDLEAFYRDDEAIVGSGPSSVRRDISYLVSEVRKLTASESCLRERVADLESRLFLAEELRK